MTATDRPIADPGRWGGWMQTYTGRAFWPLDPRPEDVDPLDIAHALAHLCRYGGHSARFYSVAEHSVLMSYAVAPENALAALLHDATEAYMVDLPRPLKRQFPDYSEAEDVLFRVIAARFGIAPTLPEEVQVADSRILRDEFAALMRPAPMSWGLDHLEPLGVEVQGWDPETAEDQFLDRLYELGGME